MEYTDNFPWKETIKKEARGIDDADFGEIQSVDPEYIITQKGIIDKEIFSFPINLVQEYDGNRVLFKVTEEEARNSYMQSQNVDLEQDDFSNNEIEEDNTTNDKSLSNITEKEENEEVIPLMSEKLDVTKRVVVDETVITRKPVKETQTGEVQLTREEIESIERISPTGASETEVQDPIQSTEEIKILLKRKNQKLQKNHMLKKKL